MLLKKLTEANGVSGNEDNVREIIISEISNYCTDIIIDSMGNIIAYKKASDKSFKESSFDSKSLDSFKESNFENSDHLDNNSLDNCNGKYINRKRIMLTAHMDEVGFIVTGITDKGYIKFKSVGAIDDRILLSKKVVIGDKKLPGIIGLRAVHLQSLEERKRIVKLKDMYIDIGAKTKAEAEKKVKLGDYIAFFNEFKSFGEGKIKSKALDDRVGCAVLIEILKENLPVDIYACFTVQEEVGLRGAQIASYEVKPDIALIIEGTTCADVPGADEHEYSTVMGEGAAISIMDKSSYSDKRLSRFLYQLAMENNIKAQYKRTVSGGNDAGKIQISRSGVITCVISAPVRYIHSPVSVMDLIDYESLKTIVKLFVLKIESFKP